MEERIKWSNYFKVFVPNDKTTTEPIDNFYSLSTILFSIPVWLFILCLASLTSINTARLVRFGISKICLYQVICDAVIFLLCTCTGKLKKYFLNITAPMAIFLRMWGFFNIGLVFEALVIPDEKITNKFIVNYTYIVISLLIIIVIVHLLVAFIAIYDLELCAEIIRYVTYFVLGILGFELFFKISASIVMIPITSLVMMQFLLTGKSIYYTWYPEKYEKFIKSGEQLEDIF